MHNNKIYAVVGPKIVSSSMCELFGSIANKLSRLGYVLRTGGSIGGDAIFEKAHPFNWIEQYLPWPNFNQHQSHYQRPSASAKRVAAECFPPFLRADYRTQLILARYSHLLLGPDLNTPAQFVLCYTHDNFMRQTKSMTIRQVNALARQYQIPLFNIARTRGINSLEKIKGY